MIVNSLQFDFYEDDYEKNFEKFSSLISSTHEDSLVLAPELCLTNFSFGKFEEAFGFFQDKLEEIKNLSKNRKLAFSAIVKEGDKFYNKALFFNNGELIYSQPKYKLFKFGDEHKYFSEGSFEQINIFEVDGVRYGMLICFEIRFIELWQKLQGVDILLIPALWGKLRKSQLEDITKAMAIINQCFVILSDSSNDDMASSSAIISPFGDRVMDDSLQIITKDIDLAEVKRMRRYMDIGLNDR
jgi:predicted amidohydrolase